MILTSVQITVLLIFEIVMYGLALKTQETALQKKAEIAHAIAWGSEVLSGSFAFFALVIFGNIFAQLFALLVGIIYFIAGIFILKIEA